MLRYYFHWWRKIRLSPFFFAKNAHRDQRPFRSGAVAKGFLASVNSQSYFIPIVHSAT